MVRTCQCLLSSLSALWLLIAHVPSAVDAEHGAALRAHGRTTKKGVACGHRVAMGVDYYPEQWPAEDMLADMTAIKSDLGADFVRVGEFMWHILEPKDGIFNFTFLDTVIDAAESLGLEVMLGTPTATVPSWLYHSYPDVLAQGPDAAEGFVGLTPAFGGRQQRSFVSKLFRKFAQRIVSRLAERYGQRKTVAFWQIDNELGNEQSDLDFSDNAQQEWRSWLHKKYDGDIDKLNDAWGTAFWATTYDCFTQVPVPRFTRPGGALQGEEEFRSNQNPGMLLDYRRFLASSITEFANMQVGILRDKSVLGCITSNTNGGYWGRAIDQNDIYAEMDFPAFDNYPVWGGSLEPDAPSKVALMLDTVRGWTSKKDRSAGWMVAEQLIGAQGHDIIGYTPRPDQIVAWSSQALLHGATSLAFFRYRAAVAGQEMFCYGILDHATPRGKGRKWKEAKKLYQLARTHEDLWLGPVKAKVALLYNIDGIFSWNAQPQSTAFEFTAEAHRMYHPFWRHGAAVDVLTMKRALDTYSDAAALLEHYSILLLPAPIIIPDALVSLLSKYVDLGGVVWVGFRADLKDENNSMRRSASRLAHLAGVEIEEFESLNSPLQTMVRSQSSTANATATVWRDGLQIPEGSAAKPMWLYTDKFFGALGYAAMSQLDKGEHGGSVIYMGSGLDAEALVPLAGDLLQRKGVPHVGLNADADLEQLLREDGNGTMWRVAIHHGDGRAVANDGTRMEAYAVDIRKAVVVRGAESALRELYE